MFLSQANEADKPNLVELTSLFSAASTIDPKASFKTVSSLESEIDFRTPIPSFGLGDSNTTYWYKAYFPKNLATFEQGYFEIPYAMLGLVKIWFYDTDNQLYHYTAGTELPFAQRAVKDGSFVFPAPQNISKDKPIIVSVNTSSSVSFSFLYWETSAWHENQIQTRMWYGFFFGCLAILIFYNFFLSLALRDIGYIYYILYLFGLATINAAGAGLIDQYLFPNDNGQIEKGFQLIIAITIVFDTLFINQFLEVKNHFPKVWRASIFGAVIIFLSAIPEFLGFTSETRIDEWLILVVIILTNIALLYYLMISIVSYRLGLKQARFVVVAFSLLFAHYIVYRLYTFQLFEFGFLTRHLLEIGTLVEGVFLSLALADRINLLANEKKKIERKAAQLNRSIAKRLINAQENERAVISEAMHSSIGHSLLVLKQNLSQTNDLCKEDRKVVCPELTEKIAQQVEFCGDILNDVRQLSQDLHPHVLKHLGLKQAIETGMPSLVGTSNIEWQTDIESDIELVNEEQKISIYRIVQDGIRCLLDSSDATEIILSIKQIDTHIVVTIKSDSLKPLSNESLSKKIKQLIIRMRGHIELLGGELFQNQSDSFMDSQQAQYFCFSIPTNV